MHVSSSLERSCSHPPRSVRGLLAAFLIVGLSLAAPPLSKAEAVQRKEGYELAPPVVRAAGHDANYGRARTFAAADDLRTDLLPGANFQRFDAEAEAHRLQILVSEVRRDGSKPELVTRGYRVDQEYLYPASAIKHLAAFALFGSDASLPLERQVQPSDTLVFYSRPPEGLSAGELENYRGRAQRQQVSDVVRRALITSSNDAFNRLYDAMGHTQLNRWLLSVGFGSARFRHRLYAFEDPIQHLLSPRVEFLRNGQVYRIKHAVQDSPWLPPNALANQAIGHRYKAEGSGTMLEGPMSFAQKNALSLSDLHRSILALMLPGHADGVDLSLEPAERAFLIDVMGEFPTGKPDRGFAQRVDRYKPLLPGIREVLGDGKVRYINKAGRAYGFHLDTAWIENIETGRAVVVSVGTYVNANGTLNDDHYEYSHSYALLAELGAWLARSYLR